MKSFISGKKAFSLVEVMVVVGLTLVVATAISALFLNTNRFFSHSNDRGKARQEASQAIRTVERELRQMTKASDSLQSIEVANKNTLEFYADIDNDNKPERIKYALANKSIQKTVYQTTNDAAPWTFYTVGRKSALTQNTTNSASKPLFKYYSSIDTEISTVPLSQAQRADVKIIKIDIRVLFPKGIKEDQFETEIYLRNTNDPL